MFYLRKWLIKLENVAYNMDYTVYLDIYFKLDPAKDVSPGLDLTQIFEDQIH